MKTDRMQEKKERGWIRIPNDRELIPAVVAYAGKIARQTGFSAGDSKKIQLAVEEACLHVITCSFRTDEEAEFDLRFIRRSDGLEVRVHDMGLPYDPKKAPVYDPEADPGIRELGGLGSYLISRMMDEFSFNNLGINGKEMVLVKYSDTPYVTNDMEKPEVTTAVVPPETGGAAGETLSIRLAEPADAPEVCRCIYDCYGYTYANENVYYPERVAAMNRQGLLRSAIAVTPEGEVAGHCALLFHDHLPPELGIAAIRKKFRGLGIAPRLNEFLEAEARNKGCKGMMIKQVTAHPHSQKIAARSGFRDCGLLLAHAPRSLSFKGINENLAQRNSDVLGFKYLAAPPPRILYAPKHHYAMMASLVTPLDDGARVAVSAQKNAETPNSILTVTLHRLRSMAEIFVLKAGDDLLAVVRSEMQKLFREEIRVFEMWLSLSDPAVAPLIGPLEKLGFIFTGVLPGTTLGDAILMQYFNGVFIDYGGIVLLSEVAVDLLEYVRRHDPHAG